eukprot:1852172-Amphidinium_carterae.2
MDTSTLADEPWSHYRTDVDSERILATQTPAHPCYCQFSNLLRTSEIVRVKVHPALQVWAMRRKTSPPWLLQLSQEGKERRLSVTNSRTKVGTNAIAQMSNYI